ncbi:uncharacterized protein LOC111707596 [Eurytemora carolleeae]|uniref:uncharacterized protein LOC111707596 n=1 Tax=Eurytemora carolleeae TaxID=1294199 RepID=UPI000C77673F|nr:uncharacterized protein LOC111707596 [Eurytemora carolleeae]|eukprot:XP_023336497.1 uncharacterized protein LOC111707596 [Eurytemora affinis]
MKGVVGGTLPYSSTAEDVNNKPNYTARCHYKQVVFSPDEIKRRSAEFNQDKSSQTKPVLEGTKLINSSDLVKIDQAKIDDHLSKSDQDQTKPQLRDTSPPEEYLEEANPEQSHHLPEDKLMLSLAERQELAENAMEELASGLNRAAQAMKNNEESSDLGDLQDTELHQLLEEAYNYKAIKKDRHGLSGTFKELLEKVEENSSGEEQWDSHFRRHLLNPDSGKKKKKKVSETNKGGSLSNLSLIDSDNTRYIFFH